MCDPMASKSAEVAVYCALFVAISLCTGAYEAITFIDKTRVLKATGVLSVVEDTGILTTVEEADAGI